jgi:hypothetical protein
MAPPWIADFAELILIVSCRKPANAHETGIWETEIGGFRPNLPCTLDVPERDFLGT